MATRPRQIELLCGLLALPIGVATWVYLLLGPTYRYASTRIDSAGRTTTVGGSASILEMGVRPETLVFLVAVLLCVIAIGVGAYLHGRHGDQVGLALLWFGATLLLAAVTLSLASTGLFLAPTTLLAVIATIAGSAAQAARHDAAS